MTIAPAPRIGLPPATARLALWVALLGGVAIVANDRFLEAGPTGAAPARRGPLPAPTAQGGLERLAAVAPAEKALRDGPAAPFPIEDPGGRALASFYRKLDEIKQGRGGVARVVQYGDSILTSDELSGQIRRVLQTEFGDAGRGFVMLGKPWAWFRQLDVRFGASGSWQSRPLTIDALSDGLYGLGGVAFESREPRATAWVATADEGPLGRRASRFDLAYLAQPRGGSFDVLVNGVFVRTVPTAAPSKAARHELIEVGRGAARLDLKLKGDGPVRIYGAVVESGLPGVQWDALAVNGARVSVLQRIEPGHWKGELAHRDPDLVVLTFGANEGHNEWLNLDEYRANMTGVLATIHAAVPEAGCLVVGALDQANRAPDGGLGSRRMPKKLARVQREVALASGCGFFDTFSAMGGEGSMAEWCRIGLGGADLIHPTEHGSRRIGEWLARALIAGRRGRHDPGPRGE